MGDADVKPDVYSNNRIPWSKSESMTKLKYRLEVIFNKPLDYVLLNLYENGAHSIAWHSDNEAQGDNDIIISISLGSDRKFHVKAIDKKIAEKYTWVLSHGDVVVMDGIMQRHYLHTVPKTKMKVNARINLTFRHT